jgi:tRNA-dihydrouridine synthase
LDAVLNGNAPALALAPMQDVTDLSFWRLLSRFGGPDIHVTEYFRVYAGSTLNRHILASITEFSQGPVIAQMIGNSIPDLVRTARELEQYPIAAVDLNLGCPAPVVYRKCAGGGLLRDLKAVDTILGALREAVRGRFTVKTRLGFDSPDVFPELIGILARNSVDMVTVHARTVKQMYRGSVDYAAIARAVTELPCAVLANGNITSPAVAEEVLAATRARGLMLGRGAIRNPWIFSQIRQHLRGEPVVYPSGREVLDYVHTLYEVSCDPGTSERARVERMKKFINYLGLGVEPTGNFLHQVRRVTTEHDFKDVCRHWLDHDQPMRLEPLPIALEAHDVMAS